MTLARSTTAHAELEISRSKFLGYTRRVENEAAAREFFAEIRAQYPDARHHCTAFSIADGPNPIERSSDDGEPSGTAGMPMLAALRGSGLIDVAVVVVRYFGGIKLGTGGLVRAYTNTTIATLDAGTKVHLVALPTWELTVGAGDAGRLRAALENQGVSVLNVAYGFDPERPTDARFTLSYDNGDELMSLLASLTHGDATPVRLADRISEVAL
ncbi:hypothetical protein BSZ39_03805 [Bowdeniella nasicola]|uniref:Impact N-terminal domain-containing protein n=1 Tax=Bowdeniella nasicola TaxID=208480 RepID=A0A1Q5Q3W3_9ACTO|nr:YigZ family protein [Bowdeniella nasicola]OKL54506.1 hypothetical protein BSZ39_03805 [Bowdeniella nasicola]